MAVTSVAVFCVIFVAAISDCVTAWTIDLPEVRRYYFERYDSRSREDSKEDKADGTFDNINGDSLHNTNEFNYYNNLNKEKDTDGKDYNVYADNYRNYESYMVKKVQQVLHNGTAYLDGLRQSIERYAALLENCRRRNFTMELPPELTSPLTIGAFSGLRDYSTRCREATRSSEHVRRLAELALRTTRRLQDVAYTSKYNKDDEDPITHAMYRHLLAQLVAFHSNQRPSQQSPEWRLEPQLGVGTSKYNKDDSMEENELLLRLAWYLDKLAVLTGYDPEPHAHTTPPPTAAPLPPAIPLPLPEVSDATKAAILSCLRANGSEPATERCAYRVPQPVLRQIIARFGLNESQFRLDVPLPARVSRRSSDARASLDHELLFATDNHHALPPKRSDAVNVKVKTVRKRSITDSADPLVKVLKYYAKHKVWVNSNPHTDNLEPGTLKPETFDVKNALHIVRKRSVEPTKINKLPENPMQDLSKYLKSKPNIYYHADRTAANHLRAALGTIHKKKLISTNKMKKLSKILRHKRALPVEHVRETIKTNTDIHYDIPKDIADKLKTVIHSIPGSIAHLHELHHPHHIPHIPHVDVHHHGHHGHHDILHHHHDIGHISEDIKTNFHYDNLHKEEPVEKIKAAIHHLHAKKVVIAKKIENLRKIFRPKRSISELTDHQNVVNARIPENPQKDLSYYVKSKEGTNYNRNLGQAALLRLSLEQAFQRGNINVVHKYAANYNPAVINPFYFGILRSVPDSF